MTIPYRVDCLFSYYTRPDGVLAVYLDCLLKCRFLASVDSSVYKCPIDPHNFPVPYKTDHTECGEPNDKPAVGTPGTSRAEDGTQCRIHSREGKASTALFRHQAIKLRTEQNQSYRLCYQMKYIDIPCGGRGVSLLGQTHPIVSAWPNKPFEDELKDKNTPHNTMRKEYVRIL